MLQEKVEDKVVDKMEKEVEALADDLPALLKVKKRYSPGTLKGIRASMQKATQHAAIHQELVWICHHFSRHMSSFGGHCIGRLLCSQFPEPLGILHFQQGPQHGQDSAVFRAELEALIWPRPTSDRILKDNFRCAIDDEAISQWIAKCWCLPPYGPNPKPPDITSEQAFTQLCSIRKPLSALAFLIDTWFHERAPMPSNPPCLALDLLPMELWEIIGAELSAVDPTGFEGPSVVAPAILRLQLLSKDFAGLAKVCWAECSRGASRMIEASGLAKIFALRTWPSTNSRGQKIPAAKRDIRAIERSIGAKLPRPVVGKAALMSQSHA